jgi:hypothetical protein
MPPEDKDEERSEDDWLEGEQWSADQPEITIDFGLGERKKEPWEESEEFDLESQLLLNVVLPGREPSIEEFSNLSCRDLIRSIPPISLKRLPPIFDLRKLSSNFVSLRTKISSWFAERVTVRPSRRSFMG